MIVEKAQVVAVKDQYAIVHAQRRGACGGCSARKGCGVPLLGKLWPDRFGQLTVLNHAGARVGDHVQIGMVESGLLKSALILYVLPLLFVVLAIIVGVGILGSGISDLVSIAFCGTGFAVGLLVARLLGKRLSGKSEYQARIISIENSGDTTSSIIFSP
jgi:sigma-E factor negative regulatory protein RseC